MSINQIFPYEIGYGASTGGDGNIPELEPFDMFALTLDLVDFRVLSC